MTRVSENNLWIKSNEFLIQTINEAKTKYEMEIISNYLYFVFIGRDEDKVNFIYNLEING
jgi:hypothetical protein